MKVEDKMKDALSKCISVDCSSNTKVCCEFGLKIVFLHKNIIFMEFDGNKWVWHKGFHTKTTASRLRALGANVAMKNGKLHLNGKPMIEDKPYLIS